MDPWFSMNLIDVNGMDHDLKTYHITMMLLFGWFFFIVSYIVNIVYYIIHPSGVNLNIDHITKKFYSSFEKLTGNR